MEMDDIRLAELGQGSDVCTGVGDVDGKQVFPVKAV